MLAAIDDESDEDRPQEPQTQTRMPLSSVSPNVQKVDSRKELAQGNRCIGEEEEDEDEDEDEESLFLPRGRLAARLSRQAAIRNDSSPSDKGSLDENAYARIKKQLITNGNKVAKDLESDTIQATSDREADGPGSTIPSRSGTLSIHSPVSRPSKNPNSSPGLFLTPGGDSKTQDLYEKLASKEDSDSDLGADPQNKRNFLELVARYKAEREAKQAAEDQKRQERVAKQWSLEKEQAKNVSAGSGISDDDEITDRRLTQQSRPTRKASKKAVEEISRETQRMSRNMQLAHQAKTKKTITKDSLFARFNFRNSATPTAEVSQHPTSSTVASSAPVSDSEDAQNVPSPPTSPIEQVASNMDCIGVDPDKIVAPVDAATETVEEDGEDLPEISDIMNQSVPKIDKGKGKVVDHGDIVPGSASKERKRIIFTQPPIKIRPPKPLAHSKTMDFDSESDLEVVPVKKSRSSKVDVFDRLPANKGQEGRTLQTLRALAHLTSPGKQTHGKQVTMSLADMQTSLQKRARQQAMEERAAKIEDLKSRGIIVQTAEERQQDQVEVEDMIEKARRENKAIEQKEKRAAKKAKIANGEVDDLPDTSDEDEDYQEGQGANPEVDRSGSEEEEGDDSEALDERVSDAEESANEDEEEGGALLDKERSGVHRLVDNEASEDGDDEEEEEMEIDFDTEDDEQPHEIQIQRGRRNKMVIDDDDEDDDDEAHEAKIVIPLQPDVAAIEKPALPENPFKPISAPMGLTQAFAATMGNTETQVNDIDEEQDSMAMFDSVPEPDFPIFDANDSLDVVEDSQNGLQRPETNSSKDLELHFSQSQIQYDASRDTQDQFTPTQMSEIPDPTQDVGFASSPAPETRFVSEPPSTVDTVLLSGAAGNGSLVKKKKGRLQRRTVVEEPLSDEDEDSITSPREIGEVNTEHNAFDAMKAARKAAKAAAAKEAFDKKKSEAKDMVEDQAQESEDEYAGLGGASDEDSGEEDEDVKAMMDHGEVNVDESKLAGFYA